MNFRHSSIQRRRDRRPKKDKKLFTKIAIFCIAILFFQFYYYGFMVGASTDPSNSVTISVDPGEGLKDVSKKLKKANVINSKLLFVYQAKKQDLDTKIQSGVFTIPLPQNINSALQIVTTVPVEDKITIPEGLKISQIDELLANKGLITPGQFIDCVQNCALTHPVLDYIPSQSTRNLEGFLFPDTYFINTANFTSESIIIKMLDNFQNRLPANYQSLADKLPETDLYSVIKMASIIEREVLSKKDKQLVSGLLWKRYESDWLIDADAALLYNKTDNIITRADLDSDSPYNLRKIKGLPPTPISNPGTASITAALEPIASAYWFYLTTLDTGEVIYARTNDEHNQNRFKYLK